MHLNFTVFFKILKPRSMNYKCSWWLIYFEWIKIKNIINASLVLCRNGIGIHKNINNSFVLFKLFFIHSFKLTTQTLLDDQNPFLNTEFYIKRNAYKILLWILQDKFLYLMINHNKEMSKMKIIFLQKITKFINKTSILHGELSNFNHYYKKNLYALYLLSSLI